MPASIPIRIAVISLTGLIAGFSTARLFRTAEPPVAPPINSPDQTSQDRPDRPWLNAWLAEQTSALSVKKMPEVPPHLVPDTTDAQISRLAANSVPAAISAIENITDDRQQRLKITERLILDPLLRADPVAALDLARTWKDYDKSTSHNHSYLFYDVPAGKYPELATALIAEPPGPFRATELPLFLEMWAKRAPVAAATWIAETLPADSPDTASLSAIATAALVKPGVFPPDLASALEGAPPALRSRLYHNLFDAALDAPDPAAHANQILGLTPDPDLVKSAPAFALQWSHLDPEAAAAWSLSLPTPAARYAALDGIARSWPSADPTAAATWLRTLPPLQSSIATPIFARHLKPTTTVPE